MTTANVETTKEYNENNEALLAQTESYPLDPYDAWIQRPDSELPLFYFAESSASASIHDLHGLSIPDTMRMQTRQSRRGWNINDVYIVIITGLRGAGKTLGLTYLGFLTLLSGHDVYSNFPIAFRFKFPNGKVKSFRSKRLDVKVLSSLSGKYTGSAVLISELQYYTDCRRSGSYENVRLGYDLMQIRKLDMSFFCDVKSVNWIDNRVGFETDLLIHSSDNYYTPWGDENNVPRGTVLHWDLCDISGHFSGYGLEDIRYASQLIRMHKMNSEPNPLVHQYELPMANKMHLVYPTKYLIDLDDLANIRKDENLDILNEATETAKKGPDKYMIAVEATINELRNYGNTSILVDELWYRMGIIQETRIQKKVTSYLNVLKVFKRKINNEWYFILDPNKTEDYE